MSDYKYLTDGRKVVIVGQLNAAETIVQEMFVSGKNEIPSGENFVVKSLHDAPVRSWKEKELEKIEANYDSTKKRIDHDLKDIRRKFNAEKAICGSLTKSLKDICNVGLPESLLQFLRGEITHVVKPGYSSYEIMPLGELLDGQDRFDRDLKLLTLFGRPSNGLEWRLNIWSDGSGGNQTVIPCTSFDHAREVLSEYIQGKAEKGGVDRYMIAAKERYGLLVPTPDQVTEFNKKLAASLEKSNDADMDVIAKRKKEIKELTAK